MTEQVRPNIQIDDLVREMTQEEFESFKSSQDALVQSLLEQEAKAEARSSALQKLAELGLTEEEIAAL
jgi:hypothetical protein